MGIRDHRHIRRGAAVFNDSNNKLQLVEVKVLSTLDAEGWRCDERDAERQGLQLLAENRPGEHWDYVGTLFAETGAALTRGRINWARDYERVEVLS